MNIKGLIALLAISILINVYLGYTLVTNYHLQPSYQAKEVISTTSYNVTETFIAPKEGKYEVILVVNSSNVKYVNVIITFYKLSNHGHEKKIVELNTNHTHTIVHLSKGVYKIVILYIVSYEGSFSQNYVNIKITFNSENLKR